MADVVGRHRTRAVSKTTFDRTAVPQDGLALYATSTTHTPDTANALGSCTRPGLTYRGRRAESYRALDTAELVELRARQRTFDGAYMRSSLGCLFYSILVLRLFDTRFFPGTHLISLHFIVICFLIFDSVGLLYTILAACFAVIAYARRRYSNEDFSDQNMPQSPSLVLNDLNVTIDSNGRRVFGRSFVTAGRIVVGTSVVVIVAQVSLLVLLVMLR